MKRGRVGSPGPVGPSVLETRPGGGVVPGTCAKGERCPVPKGSVSGVPEGSVKGWKVLGVPTGTDSPACQPGSVTVTVRGWTDPVGP